jgi:hypothetical protein
MVYGKARKNGFWQIQPIKVIMHVNPFVPGFVLFMKRKFLTRISHQESLRNAKDARGCKCFTKVTEATGGVLDSTSKRVKEHDAAGMGRFGIAVDCW